MTNVKTTSISNKDINKPRHTERQKADAKIAVQIMRSYDLDPEDVIDQNAFFAILEMQDFRARRRPLRTQYDEAAKKVATNKKQSTVWKDMQSDPNNLSGHDLLSVAYTEVHPKLRSLVEEGIPKKKGFDQLLDAYHDVNLYDSGGKE